MKALAVIPKKKYSVRIINLDKPTINNDEVLVKVFQAGICRTDLEINQGLYGQVPENADYLIMGHESVGIVEFIGKNVQNLNVGDYVVRTVRRPCKDKCLNCVNDENDMCLTGNYTEMGIKGLHGIFVEYYKEKPKFLVKIPKEYKHLGVLLEPLSFAEKTVYQALKIQQRMHWQPKKALVLGAGPIGILTTKLLRYLGIETYTAARSKKGNLKSRIVEELGAHYLSTTERPLEELLKGDNLDLVIEATGNASIVYDALKLLGINGVLCLTSVTGDDQRIEMPISQINLSMVLGNKVIVGIVNANIEDYKRGVIHFSDFENKWPGLMKRLITKKIHLNNYKEGFKKERDDIKTVISFEA